jgi:putative ABC transport system permease protein
MDTLRQDIRYAFATLRSNRAFAAAALVTLALGIGATTAVFSVVYGVLLEPLPYPYAARLVQLSEERPGSPLPAANPILTNYTYYALAEAPRTLDAIAAANGRDYTVNINGVPERIPGVAVTPSLFPLLGMRPALGRVFTDAEAAPGSNLVVVLSDAAWRTRFAADAGVVGRAITIDGRPYTIVGVAPPDFYYPTRDAALWTPYRVPPPADPSSGRFFVAAVTAIGRLAAGATPAQAEAEATAVARRAAPPAGGGRGLFGGPGGEPIVHVASLVDYMTRSVRPAILVLAGSVVLVLLIACANVANLFLSRGVARQRELAVRAAIGASGWRLGRQLLTESLVVSLAGGAIGVAIAWALVRLLPALAPPDFPRLDDVQVNGPALAFAAATSLFTALASGLAPALRGARFNLSPSLHGGDGATAGGFRSARAGRLRDGLLVAEAAFAVVLMVGAALLAHSFRTLIHVDGGYDPNNVVTTQIFLPGLALDAPGSGPRLRAVTDQMLERLRAMPGVESAGAGAMLPFQRNTMIAAFPLNIVGRPAPDQPTMVRALRNMVTPGYAEALGLRLKAGRFLAAADEGASGNVAMMVNEEFARVYLPPDPVGTVLQLAQGQTAEVVGVVGNVLKDGNDRAPQAETYGLLTTANVPAGFVVRAAGNPAALVPIIHRAVREIDAGAAADVALLSDRLAASVDQPRFAMTVLMAFALLALLLASVGLYGVLSYGVQQRRREMGVRAALGAERGALIRLVMRRGLGVTAIGLALGLIASVATTRALAGLLFGVTPLDPVAFAAAPLVLLPVAVAASLLPAMRAASVDPSEALRCE